MNPITRVYTVTATVNVKVFAVSDEHAAGHVRQMLEYHLEDMAESASVIDYEIVSTFSCPDSGQEV